MTKYIAPPQEGWENGCLELGVWNVLTWKKVVLKDATLGQPHLSMQLTLLASPSVFIPPRKFCLHQTLCPTIRPVGTQHVLLQCPLLSSGGHTTPLFKSFDYQPSLCEYFQIFFWFLCSSLCLQVPDRLFLTATFFTLPYQILSFLLYPT